MIFSILLGLFRKAGGDVVRLGETEIDSAQMEAPNHSSLLVSILIRYPQIATLRYYPENEKLTCLFMVQGALSSSQLRKYRAFMSESLDVFGELSGHSVSGVNLEYHTYDQFTMLELNRNVVTLTGEELSLLVSLTQSFFGETLVIDPDQNWLEDDYAIQEELINHLLDGVKQEKPTRDLIGFRDEGRVFVFNKEKHERTSS